MKLAYDGTGYCGWQSQTHGNTVQQNIELGLKKVTRQDLAVMGCGRTDTGVHASEYYLHFDWDSAPDDRFLYRLNNALPKDITVYECFRVVDNFHSRFSATYRKYQYHIIRHPEPFLRDWAYFRYGELDIGKMQKACDYLLSCRDFKSFSKSQSADKTFLCHLTECHWEVEGKQLIFNVMSDRFLRNMVRAMVGTLLDIGSGRLTIEELPVIMEAGNRCKAGVSVPAKGLFLTEIGYSWEKYLIHE